MAGISRGGSFLLCLIINLLLDLSCSIPAWICLALHFWVGLSIWWFIVAIGLWVLGNVLWMCFMGWASRCGSEKTPPRENKNPYSVGNGR